MIELLDLLIPSINETLYMVFISTVFTVILGLPLGILLVITREDSVLPNSKIYNSLSILINITRSIPFVILMIFIKKDYLIRSYSIIIALRFVRNKRRKSM